MPGSVEKVLDAARSEWHYWGDSTWDLVRGKERIEHTDKDPEYADYVLKKYCAFVPGGNGADLVSIMNDDWAWSAVGMSRALQIAGYTKGEFPFSARHSDYIRHFVAARKTGQTGAKFLAYRLNEKGGEPAPGDLVAYARPPKGKSLTSQQAATRFDSTKKYNSHCDVVVEVRDNEIDVIGFNVKNSVTLKTLRLSQHGHIDDQEHLWFAVLKRQ